jgi:hypothetical protein
MKRLAIIVPTLLVVCVAGWYFEWSPHQDLTEAVAHSKSFERRDGKADAEADIERGAPRWKVIGLERADLERRVMLLDRLGVHLDRIADCEVDEAILKYVEAYNAVIRSYTLKHGTSAIDDALSDADTTSYTRRKKKG